MASKAYILKGIASIFGTILVICFIKKSPGHETRESVYNMVPFLGKSRENLDVELRVLIQQRNNISRQLNLKQQKLGQLQCEQLKNVRIKTSETGGWCENRSYKLDEPLAVGLADIFKGKFVASFGDGSGLYKKTLLASGKLKGYDAYDGAPYCELFSNGRVKFLDLTLQQFGLPIYDWSMSLEVAEHIPAEFESIFIDNIIRHTKEGVVLSWATPGQGGYSHVNCRSLDYVIKLMDSLGFSHDEDASNKLTTVATIGWLKRNTNVYIRRNRTINENQL